MNEISKRKSQRLVDIHESTYSTADEGLSFSSYNATRTARRDEDIANELHIHNSSGLQGHTADGTQTFREGIKHATGFKILPERFFLGFPIL